MRDGKRDDDDGKHSYSQQCQDAEMWTLNIFTYRIQMFQVHMQVDSVITVIGPRFVVVAVMTVSGALVTLGRLQQRPEAPSFLQRLRIQQTIRNAP
jgi:hypothetical protein